ncbi:MAG: hypothetical protein K0S10_1103, partial [Rubrobacteraceae bacterium]|nr:hypothetical protein [Rubrobacteraceae bacterium]
PRRPLLVGRKVIPSHVGAHDLEDVFTEDVLHRLLYDPGYLLVVITGR